MASKKNGTLYIGVTNNLVRRVYEHKEGLFDGFTKKYKVKNLVYFEIHNSMYEAIKREKAMKKWLRKWKIKLIEKENFDWRDLYDEITY